MKRISFTLQTSEIAALHDFKKSGKKSQREYNRANILLLLGKGKKDKEIEELLGVNRCTIWRIRKRFLEEGLSKTLKENPRSGQPKKYTQDQKDQIIALARTKAPQGKKWTLELLAAILSKKKGLETINRETIRLTLKKAKIKLN